MSKFKLLSLFLLLTSYIYADEKMIEDYINKSLEVWNVPGASIAIVKDNKIILAKGFGYKNLEKSENNRVDAETLFPIASLTKSFTSIAGGIFADQQHLSWDTPIKSLFPAFKLPEEYPTNTLTIRDCLSMRAGLVAGSFEDEWWNQSNLTEKKLLEALQNTTFPCQFRGCFAYENLAYNIIGHLFEIKTGKSWELFVKEYLLDKLDMYATTTNYEAFLKVKNKAIGHQWEENRIKEVPFERLDVIAAGAGLSSNANDMAKWLQFILNKNSQYSSITKSTLTPQVIVDPKNFFLEKEACFEKVFFPNSHFLNYGMGWFVHDYKGMTICQDPGLVDGINGLMAVVPEMDLGIVILNNLEAPFFSHSVLFHVIDHYKGQTTDWDQILQDIGKGH